MKFKVGDKVRSKSDSHWRKFSGVVVSIRSSRVAPYFIETRAGREYHSARDMELDVVEDNYDDTKSQSLGVEQPLEAEQRRISKLLAFELGYPEKEILALIERERTV